MGHLQRFRRQTDVLADERDDLRAMVAELRVFELKLHESRVDVSDGGAELVAGRAKELGHTQPACSVVRSCVVRMRAAWLSCRWWIYTSNTSYDARRRSGMRLQPMRFNQAR